MTHEHDEHNEITESVGHARSLISNMDGPESYAFYSLALGLEGLLIKYFSLSDGEPHGEWAEQTLRVLGHIALDIGHPFCFQEDHTVSAATREKARAIALLVLGDDAVTGRIEEVREEGGEPGDA